MIQSVRSGLINNSRMRESSEAGMNKIARRKLSLAIAFAAVIFVSSGSFAETPAPVFRAEVSATARGRAYSLEFSITNATDHPLRLSKREVPWECPDSILILVAEYRHRHTMEPLPTKRQIFVSACPEGETILAPGAAINGAIDLGDRVKGLPKLLERDHALVFWHWRPQSVESGENEGYGGLEILRKNPAAHSEASAGSEQSVARVSGYALDDVQEPSLVLVVSNTGPENISIYLNDMPWAWNVPVRLAMRAQTTRPSRPLSAPYELLRRRTHSVVPWMNRGSYITIPPDGSAVGAVPVSRYVESLADARRSSDVVVFWAAEIASTSGATLGLDGGFVVFPKK